MGELSGISRGGDRTEFVLHGHDDLHVVQRVQAQVVDEVRVDRQLEHGKRNNTDRQREQSKQPLMGQLCGVC